MRKLLLYLVVVSVGIIYTGRLSYLQLFNEDAVATNFLNDSAIKAIYDYPERGFVYDRNGELLVANQPSYDVMVVPREVKEFNVAEFCKLLRITEEEYEKKLEKAKSYSWRIPSIFVAQMAKKDYAFLQEKMHRFKGFYIQKRSIRNYQTSVGANVLGSIGEVNNGELKRNPNYQSGELIGKTGIEKSYEDELRGQKGVKYIQKDIHNNVLGSYKNGRHDTLAVNGKDIQITIDAKLQEYGEKLMVNKRGGIVAIEPSSGEILALITAPSYNPNLLVGRKRSKNYNKLHYDSINKPLYDRGLLAMYPPGSPFKTLNALVALQEDVVTPQTTYTCRNGYIYGRSGRKMGCHCGSGKRNVINGVAKSCNAYFANAYRQVISKYDKPREGMNVWSNHIKSFGLGNYFGNDLSTGRKGRIPSGDYYTNDYFKHDKWHVLNTISNAIGQGQVEMTPIQLAHMTATIANRGHYYTPHIIKAIDGKPIDNPHFTEPKYTTIDQEHFEPVIQGMHDVFSMKKGGTARFLNVPGIEICGKTGTAENFVKIDGKRTQLTDHSIFVAFAPKENPKIAIAVFVENGYYGARWAGKISSLMIEKYLKGEITLKDMEKLVLEKSLEDEYAKPLSGKPFTINE
ncbi:penicillin-binding protein 2 [Kordia algicida OT-1]|uniref:Penicillin-binding protein 2 (PBP-2) n=1 Tax=Kordia algicida OT-1 TaxID=391587 RepID=A9DK17_9FLAO|nr:penicillin-binding protein 2 [Kordia algicida]EDP98240.1 penicillin-binding protein 2 (PBP-2) [Kordia algicida OT-1]